MNPDLMSATTRIAISLGLGCFAVYLWTACPTVYLGDSGELAAAAYSLGIPHNSGYPLYALIGKLFCLIPFGSIAFRMNLMSAFSCACTVALLYDLLYRKTGSHAVSIATSLFLAFTSLFWMQAVSAEVYGFHLFFVVILIRLLWRWDEKRDFRRLMLLTFVAGLSFCNHMQTIVLAPAVLLVVLRGQGKSFLKPETIVILTLLFIAALSLYAYLPVRTNAGAAITWGDPDTIGRFWDHVTARDHRSGYVLNKGTSEYLKRMAQSIAYLFGQFGVLLPLSVWGLVGLRSRWRGFFVFLVLSDLTYTAFLNTISLEITPFALPTMIAVAILSGVGMADVIRRVRTSNRFGLSVKRAVQVGFILIPVIPFMANVGFCNQSRNYAGYEHALNILRTAEIGSVILVDGDNHIFPLMYVNLCEGMAEDRRIIDRFNLVFRWSAGEGPENHPHSLKTVLEEVVREDPDRMVYLCAFDPNAFPLPQGYSLAPHGILSRVVERNSSLEPDAISSLWRRYAAESFYGDIQRDYMNRQICAYYHFNMGKSYFQLGSPGKGLEAVRLASKIGYNDELIHSDIGIFLTQQRLFPEAYEELRKALIHGDDLSLGYNNLGYYYGVIGDFESAVANLQKAVELSPDNHTYLNNLGFALYKSDKKRLAAAFFRRSLEIVKEQAEIEALLNE
jgi:hypothetical protein